MKSFNNKGLIKVQDIDAALQFGQCYSSNIWRVSYIFGGVVSILMILLSLLALLFGSSYYDDILTSIIVGISMGTFLFLCNMFLFLMINSGKKKVRLWLQDAVIIKAKTEKIDVSFGIRAHLFAAIQIRFIYNEKKYVKSSVKKGNICCLPIYNKYVDKEIYIAYSPKYDQVMLIKPQSEQKILEYQTKYLT